MAYNEHRNNKRGGERNDNHIIHTGYSYIIENEMENNNVESNLLHGEKTVQTSR